MYIYIYISDFNHQKLLIAMSPSSHPTASFFGVWVSMAVLMTTVLGKICSFDTCQTQGSLDRKFLLGAGRCKANNIPIWHGIYISISIIKCQWDEFLIWYDVYHLYRFGHGFCCFVVVHLWHKGLVQPVTLSTCAGYRFKFRFVS